MRILIADDEKELCDFLKTSFEAELFVVDTVHDGINAAHQILTTDYDLVILDNVLPGKSGMEICQEVRSKGKKVPIISLSVRSEIPTKVELLTVGADDYVTKPFSFYELLARIKALLRRPQQLEKEIAVYGDLIVDSARHVVSQNNKEIYLTKKEFQLLELLLKNKGNVVSRGMILEHVWDNDGDVFSNSIETHILNLRKKIDSSRKRKLIHTVSGRGYKIV